MLTEPAFLENVNQRAAQFKVGLARLQAAYPELLLEVRQRGLMMGLNLASPALGPLWSRIGFSAGVLTVYANNDPSVVQLLPPLIIDHQASEDVLARLESILAQMKQFLA